MAGEIVLVLFSSVFMLVLSRDKLPRVPKKTINSSMSMERCWELRSDGADVARGSTSRKIDEGINPHRPRTVLWKIDKNRSSAGRRIMHADSCTFICICLC